MKPEEIDKLEKVVRKADAIYPHMRNKMIEFITKHEILIGDMIQEPYRIKEFFNSLGYYVGFEPHIVYDEETITPSVKYRYRILYILESGRDDEKPSTSTFHGRVEHDTEFSAFIAVCKSIFDHMNERFTPESRIFYV